ncbi:MAG: ribose 5-phosphate isomerase B [Candidatus Omnitrophica bacterium]|nr:ribose 5-phosphate isomerase B [Candidatus Omnitrophota bacterium]MBL7210619.1 ribose 5-phosphate isomerase B [Candidatus Omnitrophota bacterium]
MTATRQILIASDHAGFKLKEKLKPYLERQGLAVKDLGTYSQERCDYPVLAAVLARRISTGRSHKGILICHTGIGNSIVANRFSGVRASLCYNPKAARLTREHNDSNVLVLGAAFVSVTLAKKITCVWLNTKFSGGRHKRRLELLKKIEKEIRA